MGYVAIIVLVFYIVTAFLMWFGGMFIAQSSPMREQVDIGVLVLSDAGNGAEDNSYGLVRVVFCLMFEC